LTDGFYSASIGFREHILAGNLVRFHYVDLTLKPGKFNHELI